MAPSISFCNLTPLFQAGKLFLTPVFLTGTGKIQDWLTGAGSLHTVNI